MSTQPDFYILPEDYLELERHAETKSEYCSGAVYAMAGASPRHNAITANLIASLYNQLQGGSCRVYASDLRVKVSATQLYTYPDATVICGGLKYDELDANTITNPSLIVEVLSPSTESYDRGEKFVHYQYLGTLTDYILVSQDKPRVEHYHKQGEGEWLLKIVENIEGSLTVSSLDLSLALSAIYGGVEFP